MKLHLGSGTHPTVLADWVNVDIGELAGTDVQADGFALPFRTATFDAAYLGHVAEHIAWERLPAFGRELRRVLALCSPVMCVGPDIARAVALNQPPELLMAIISGEGDGPGSHQWIATERMTLRALKRMGLIKLTAVDVATVTSPTWPNTVTDAWQCAVLATRPGWGACSGKQDGVP